MWAQLCIKYKGGFKPCTYSDGSERDGKKSGWHRQRRPNEAAHGPLGYVYRRTGKFSTRTAAQRSPATSTQRVGAGLQLRARAITDTIVGGGALVAR